MKRVQVVVLLFLFPFILFATQYYVSPQGDDTNNFITKKMLLANQYT